MILALQAIMALIALTVLLVTTALTQFVKASTLYTTVHNMFPRMSPERRISYGVVCPFSSFPRYWFHFPCNSLQKTTFSNKKNRLLFFNCNRIFFFPRFFSSSFFNINIFFSVIAIMSSYNLGWPDLSRSAMSWAWFANFNADNLASDCTQFKLNFFEKYLFFVSLPLMIIVFILLRWVSYLIVQVSKTAIHPIDPCLVLCRQIRIVVEK